MTFYHQFGVPMAFRGIEAMEARVEVLMAEAIEALDEIARSLIEPDEEPIPIAKRREVALKVCAETFDRLQLEKIKRTKT